MIDPDVLANATTAELIELNRALGEALRSVRQRHAQFKLEQCLDNLSRDNRERKR